MVFICGDGERIGVDGGFFETPELSASMIVDKSTESGGPGDGVLSAKAFSPT